MKYKIYLRNFKNKYISFDVVNKYYSFCGKYVKTVSLFDYEFRIYNKNNPFGKDEGIIFNKYSHTLKLNKYILNVHPEGSLDNFLETLDLRDTTTFVSL